MNSALLWTLTIFTLLLIECDYAKKGGRGLEKPKSAPTKLSSKKANTFLSYKDCMKAMNCGPSLKKDCAEECRKGNTKEEVEEHVEKLRKVQRFAKDAKDAKRMSKRADTDLSDDDSDSTDSDDDDSSEEQFCRIGDRSCTRVSSQKADKFLSYRDCMKRMNCGKASRKECKEECKEGNTEEEIEEHGSFLRKIDKYIAEAKRLKSSLQNHKHSDSSTSDDDDDTTTTTDTDDSDSDDTDTDSDTTDSDSSTDSDDKKQKSQTKP